MTGNLFFWYKTLTESIAVLYEIYEIYSLGLLPRLLGWHGNGGKKGGGKVDSIT